MKAEFGSAERTPGDAIASAVKAAERTGQARHIRQQVLFGDKHFIHHDLAGDRRAQRELALDLRRRQALHPFLENETLNAAFIVLCPDDEHVGNRRVGNPHLRAVQFVAAGNRSRTCFHRAGIRPVVGLGKAEAADPFAGRELRQVFLALRLSAIGVDRIHHQRRLHAHHRAIAGVDVLDLARDQSV